MSKNKDTSLLRRWLRGEVDWCAMPPLASDCPDGECPAYTPHWNEPSARSTIRRGQWLYRVSAAALCVIFAAVMLLAVGNLPAFGSAAAPTVNEVAERYVAHGTGETGAVNTVAGMILDYRAFDTLGESFVLFTAMCCVTMLMQGEKLKKKRPLEPEALRYAGDPIVRTVCKLVIPIILLFGIYVVLNGHLSPGGGFSGGSIMAAGLIIYAIVWGEETASRKLPSRALCAIVLCALLFYCVSKSYSFFVGANHLPSFITPGTPGRILSAGLILPLNTAVGFVVCCTMYSFYMYFRRGEL